MSGTSPGAMNGPAHYRFALWLIVIIGVTGALCGATQSILAARTLTSGYLVLRMGVLETESEVRRGIAFQPFTPPRRIVAAALLPPYHGDDVRANRGIAFEYMADSGRLYVLAQWPAHGRRLNHFISLANPDPECPDAHEFIRGVKPNGIVWSTPRGSIMSLQADGPSAAQTLQTEWRKLIRRGACR